MDLDLLRLFLDVCELGSFSRVAALQSVSQSAISQRMNQLERSLGQKLFDRKAKPLAMTPAGQIVYESARRMMAVQSQMFSHLDDLQPHLSGPVRLGCIFSLALGPLRQILRAFMENAPKVDLHVAHGETYDLAQAVSNGLLDLALVAYGEQLDGIQMEPAGTEPMVLVASKHTRGLPSGKNVVSWLNDQPFVTFPHHSPTRQAIDRIMDHQGIQPRPVLQVSNPVVLVEAVAAERGCALLPFSSVIRELESGELVRIPCPEIEHERPICLLLHRRRPRTRATRALADFLKTRLPTLQQTWRAHLGDFEGAACPAPKRTRQGTSC